MNNVQILMMNKITESKGHGYLYNGHSVVDADFAPTDWRVPTKSDYDILVSYLGGLSVAGGKIKETGTSNWDSPNTGATNSSGFTALPAGLRDGLGRFFYINERTNFWSQTPEAGSYLYNYQLDYNSAAITTPIGHNSDVGYSVRLVYTGAGSPTTLIDEDDNLYDVVQIGTQYWTVQNWKCTKLNDGTALTKVTSATTWANAGAGDLYYCAYNNDESNV